MKVFRWMNGLNGIHVFMYLLSMIFVCIGRARTDVFWYNAAGHMMMFPLVLPLGPISWLIALVYFIRNAHKAELDGRGKWLIIWPLAEIALFFSAVLMLAGLSGM